MEEGKKEILAEKIAEKYYLGIRAMYELPNQFCIVSATGLCDALQQGRRLFPQIAFAQPDDMWLHRNSGRSDFKAFFLEQCESWGAEEVGFLCAFRAPAEMQFWDSPKILAFYREKNVEANWSE